MWEVPSSSGTSSLVVGLLGDRLSNGASLKNKTSNYDDPPTAAHVFILAIDRVHARSPTFVDVPRGFTCAGDIHKSVR